MLTLEAVFTAVLAWRWYGESMDKRVIVAVLLLLAGGLVLVANQGSWGQARFGGLLAVMLATLAWGVDNTLSRALAQRDPAQVVLAKAVLGAMCSGTLAACLDDARPQALQALGLLAVGATGYGLSLRFYMLAQRSLGAARTGSVFAFAPFIGALAALAWGERFGGWPMVLAGALMLSGVLLHLTEVHAHEHTHEAVVHAHAHRHDDGHHDHVHQPMPTGMHSHGHSHPRLTHAHPHVPDALHEHSHA
jgi:drug/metabolite transporter (DMT)-like permease